MCTKLLSAAACDSIASARLEGRPVFVHCKQGKSRSGLAVTGWLMKYEKGLDAHGQHITATYDETIPLGTRALNVVKKRLLPELLSPPSSGSNWLLGSKHMGQLKHRLMQPSIAYNIS